MRINKIDMLNSLPPDWPDNLLPEIQTRIKESGKKIVVLDDDPTGTQTVHNVPVLTEWSVESLEIVFTEPEAVVYILTNSRSVPLKQAQAMNRDIAKNLKAAGQVTGRDFVVVSRSDSTLRGHYPGEVTALVEILGQEVDGTLIIPFFLEGGRYTINDIHYVAEGDQLTPAAETEFARDASFGYRHSNLREWVSQKHGGQISADRVASISLDDLRKGGPQVVAVKLQQVANGQVCVVNSASYRDQEVFVAGLLQAETAGKRFLYRTAASFVRVRGGVEPHNLLAGDDLAIATSNGGLIVAGSYIKKSTQQIAVAKDLPKMVSLEVSVEKLLDSETRSKEVNRVIRLANETIAAGQDALIFTSRKLIAGQDAVSSLEIGQTVSAALVEIVQRVLVKPGWVIAKGGITSSDTATRGLGVKRAQVLGQAIPGVPVWRTGTESRWPDLVFVVFPGNVGSPDALAQMVQLLRGNA